MSKEILLMEGYVQGALRKELHIALIEHLSFFSIPPLHTSMLLCLHNRSSRAKLLKTEEVGKAFSVTVNKTNSITVIFFL